MLRPPPRRDGVELVEQLDRGEAHPQEREQADEDEHDATEHDDRPAQAGPHQGAGGGGRGAHGVSPGWFAKARMYATTISMTTPKNITLSAAAWLNSTLSKASRKIWIGVISVRFAGPPLVIA